MLQFGLRAFVAAVALVVAISGPTAAQTSGPPTPPSPTDAFFDDTVLHEIRLNLNSKDWAALKANAFDNTYYPSDLRWRDQVVRNIGIRSRGTMSRSGVKPGLRVDFDHYTTGQKFLGTLKSFVLRNNTTDATGLHERISMLLFRRMGVPAPREAHARLYVNNDYAGLYTSVEAVDKAYLTRVYKEDGGYLYKYDRNAGDEPWYFDDHGSDPRLYVPHPFKPETHEWDPWPEKVAELVQIINRDSDAIFRRTIEPFLDLGQFIKHIAIEIVLGDADGFNGNWGMNNFYFYRFENKDRFQFIPWDKSETFKEGPEYGIWHNILDVPASMQNRLTMRIVGDQELRNKFLDTLVECARSLSQTDPTTPGDTRGWMEREIEKEYQQVRDWAAIADADKQYYSKEAFEQEVENLRTFARQRAEFVLTEVSKSRQ